ncbi:MAG TPA: DUF4897 domain-containing protein [Chloroflexota bacterium]|nr:DUF4897 domain-containing protein [Chloroflexota bacterium]
MTKILLGVFALFIFFSGMAVYQVRDRMSNARLGSDVTYTLDQNGTASARMVEKTYFIDDETRKNFEALVARIGNPDAESFGKGMEQPLTNLKDQTGRTNMAMSGFQAEFQKTEGYGARVYRFKWEGFAEQRDGRWVIDFRAANSIKLTKDSSLTVVIPPGASLLTADPAPAAVQGGKVVWSGSGEMPWPYIEYR